MVFSLSEIKIQSSVNAKGLKMYALVEDSVFWGYICLQPVRICIFVESS